jgi:hypothetical protein
MVERAKLVAWAVVGAVIARSVLYLVLAASHWGKLELIPAEAAIKTGLMALVAAILAASITKDFRRTALLVGVLLFVFANAVVYLETRFRFPQIMQHLGPTEFAIAAIQWAGVSLVSALTVFFAAGRPAEASASRA